MTSDPFLLVSLEEAESKELAQAISNKSARKILDFLSKHDSATESEVSKKLKIPLSTVHYNLQALSKANLVVAEEFHYSQKGKEVLHYKLANKLIIIAPKKTTKESFIEKMKGILPVGIIALATGVVIQLVSKLGLRAGSSAKMMAEPEVFGAGAQAGGAAMDAVAKEAAPEMMRIAAPMADEAVNAVAGSAAEVANNTTVIIKEVFVPVSHTPPEPNVALWFLIGAGFVILLLIIWYWFVTRKRKK